MLDGLALNINRLTIGGVIPVLLAATLGAVAPFPVMGQSDETCIAYMEADAAYDKARKTVWRDAREAGNNAYSAVMLPHQWRYREVYSAANKAGFEAAEKTGRRCGGIFEDTEVGRRALEAACAARNTAYRSVLEAHGVDDKAIERRAKRAETKAAEDFKRAAIKDARAHRRLAYRAAYGGPTSKVASVMDKLIKADRERCRRRLE